MKIVMLTIRNPAGLHTRPGTEFVRLARQFQSDIRIKKQERAADGKSLVKLLMIGISQGDNIELSVEGADEDQAMAALKQYLEMIEE